MSSASIGGEENEHGWRQKLRGRRPGSGSGYLLPHGLYGESAESFWGHKESWADLWTSYYTDREPQSLYVATMDDSVVGYLVGCMDTAAMTPSTDEIMQAVIRKHWLLFRPGTAGFLYRGMLDSLRDRERARGEFIDPAGQRTCTSTC